MKKKSINLFNIYKKSILWGQLDSEKIAKEIDVNLDLENDFFEFDLKGIKSMDGLFISDVFVKPLVKQRKKNKTILYIFTNPLNDEVIYNLDKELKDVKLFSILKKEDEYEIIGNSTFIKKYILKYISNVEKTNPIVISELVGQSSKSIIFEFDDFVKSGLLRKEKENEYTSTFLYKY